MHILVKKVASCAAVFLMWLNIHYEKANTCSSRRQAENMQQFQGTEGTVWLLFPTRMCDKEGVGSRNTGELLLKAVLYVSKDFDYFPCFSLLESMETWKRPGNLQYKGMEWIKSRQL